MYEIILKHKIGGTSSVMNYRSIYSTVRKIEALVKRTIVNTLIATVYFVTRNSVSGKENLLLQQWFN